MTNKEFAETDELFRKACELAGIPPTVRQASRWRSARGKGKALQFKSIAMVALGEEAKNAKP